MRVRQGKILLKFSRRICICLDQLQSVHFLFKKILMFNFVDNSIVRPIKSSLVVDYNIGRDNRGGTYK